MTRCKENSCSTEDAKGSFLTSETVSPKIWEGGGGKQSTLPSPPEGDGEEGGNMGGGGSGSGEVGY